MPTEMLNKNRAIQYLGEAIASLATDALASGAYLYAEDNIKKALSIVKNHNNALFLSEEGDAE